MHRWISLLLLLGACTATGYTSSFLPDRVTLQPQDDGTNVWVSETLVEYDRILVKPFVVYFHPNVQYDAIDPNELDNLLMQMRGAAIAILDDDYLLAREPGPGVLLIEVAVTNLHEQALHGLGLETAIVEMRGEGSMNGRLELAAQNKQALRGLKLSGADNERWAEARLVAEKGARWLKAQIDRAGE
jgi:hypothetical protein